MIVERELERGKGVKDGVPALCTYLQGGINVRVIAIKFAKAYPGKHLFSALCW